MQIVITFFWHIFVQKKLIENSKIFGDLRTKTKNENFFKPKSTKIAPKSADPWSGVLDNVEIRGDVYLPPTPLRPGAFAAKPSSQSA